MFNVVENSIKFTDQGFIKIQICMKEKGVQMITQKSINGSKIKREIEFTVEDSGKGLSIDE